MFDWLFPLLLEPLKSFIAGALWMLAIILIGFLFWYIWIAKPTSYNLSMPEDVKRFRQRLQLEEGLR